MSAKQTILFPPPVRDSTLSEPERKYLFTLQSLHPLIEVDTSAGNQSIALPQPGLTANQTGQSNQNQEIIYIKTSADGNTATITGAASGPVTLSTRWAVVRFKSNASVWYEACCGSSGSSAPAGFPTPDVARAAIWQSQANSATIEAALDSVVSADSGALDLSEPASATAGPSFRVQVIGGGFGATFRQYLGGQLFYTGRSITLRGVIEAHFDIPAAQGEHYQGISDVVSGGSDPLGGGQNSILIGIQKVVNVAAGNFKLFVNNNGVVTSADSGVAVADSTRFTWQITITGSTATLSINGAVVATLGGIPAAVLSLLWYAHGNATGAGGSNFFWFEYLYGQIIAP